jgi:hypothetical protein
LQKLILFFKWVVMHQKTRIVVQVDPQFTHSIFLRGEGVDGFSWEKGVAMKHEKPDEWVFETDTTFSNATFKVLVDDITYEIGENHPLYPGVSIRINPKFPRGS